MSSIESSIKYKQTTKMNCPICCKELFIYSYENTHLGSNRCKMRADNPIKKKHSDRIRCCDKCDYSNTYSNTTRIKKHRLTCFFYNQTI